MKRSEALAFRAAIDKSVKSVTVDNDKIAIEIILPKWKLGNHTKGDCYTANGQVWECFQSYNNAVYPDINPENSAWYTFNRSLHGTSVETALPFVHPTGAHDMYKLGEYAIWTDNGVYKCLSDTAYSPAEYFQAWQKIN